MLAVLGRSWAYVGGLGQPVRDLGASVAALGTYVGGPGRFLAEKWPKPERAPIFSIDDRYGK